MENNGFRIEFINQIARVDKASWDRVASKHHPFVSYAFLHALEASNSVNAESGWQPHHLLIYQNDQLIGMLPLYSKTHSYGEYVFDFAWANAYHQHGLEYYPKLVATIPFTPVTGSRLMLSGAVDHNALLPLILDALKEFVSQQAHSSLHWLFVDESTSKELSENGLLQRRSVQFQWFNRGYNDFTDFLSHFTARRRKSIRKERQKMTSSQISVQRVSRQHITDEQMVFFYQCYRQTYRKRSGHDGYLTEAFFNMLLKDLSDNLLLVIALRDERPIASALYLFDEHQLCGRYWGSMEDVDGLHFECCYYQGIEFCIERGIKSFNPGTQGEHKILRGFEPIFCYSNHCLQEPAFHHAIERFLQQETPEIKQYKDNAASLLPFKQST